MKSKKRIGFGAAVVLALTLLVPAQAAHAIDYVNCDGRADFLKITWNYDENGAWCYANEGDASFFGPQQWASKISTGNNNILWKADGVWHFLSRWHVLTFPTVGTIHLESVRIL